jgi:hypothetical protein
MSQVFVLDTNKQPLDPSSRTTGMALVNDASGEVVWAALLTHRGEQISRVCNVVTWVRRLMRLCPVTNISLELVRFDTQVLENPDREFLKDQPERLARILAQMKASLRDAAAVNATRWMLYARLKTLGLPVECGSGGRTKFNRVTRALPKTHWLDAACVGTSTPESLIIQHIIPLQIRATGHGVVTDVPHRFCVLVARSDGYTYQQGKESALPPFA